MLKTRVGRGEGWYSPYNVWLGYCLWLGSPTLTLFHTKICSIPVHFFRPYLLNSYPLIFLTWFIYPYLFLDSLSLFTDFLTKMVTCKIYTLFQKLDLTFLVLLLGVSWFSVSFSFLKFIYNFIGQELVTVGASYLNKTQTGFNKIMAWTDFKLAYWNGSRLFTVNSVNEAYSCSD